MTADPVLLAIKATSEIKVLAYTSGDEIVAEVHRPSASAHPRPEFDPFW